MLKSFPSASALRLLGALVTASTVGLFWTLIWEPTTPDSARADGPSRSTEMHSTPDPSIRNMRAELARLRAEMRRLAAQQRHPQIPAVEVRTDSDDEDQAAPSPDDRPDPEQRAWQTAIHRIEEQYQIEESDPGWSTETELAIEATLGATAPGGDASISARCQTTLCRIEMTHDDAESADALLQQVPDVLRSFEEGVYQRSPDDPAGAVVYLARAGHRLPRLGDESRPRGRTSGTGY